MGMWQSEKNARKYKIGRQYAQDKSHNCYPFWMTIIVDASAAADSNGFCWSKSRKIKRFNKVKSIFQLQPGHLH